MKPKVVVVIDNGLVISVMTSFTLLDEIEVIIQDYDVEADDAERTKVDIQGDACVYQLWEEADFEQLSDVQESYIDQQVDREG